MQIQSSCWDGTNGSIPPCSNILIHFVDMAILFLKIILAGLAFVGDLEATGKLTVGLDSRSVHA